jgi:hypothetical protein
MMSRKGDIQMSRQEAAAVYPDMLSGPGKSIKNIQKLHRSFRSRRKSCCRMRFAEARKWNEGEQFFLDLQLKMNIKIDKEMK